MKYPITVPLGRAYQIGSTIVLRTKSNRKCHPDKTPATGRTGSCQNDTCRRSQRWQSHQKRRPPFPPTPVNFLTNVIVITGLDIYSSNCASTYVWIDTFFQLLTISWNGQAPYPPLVSGNFLEPGQIPGRPGLVALVPSQWIDTCVNTDMDNNNKALCGPNRALSVSL